jgi:uncharacterized surface protein with fasciclin (FAS1) repeats
MEMIHRAAVTDGRDKNVVATARDTGILTTLVTAIYEAGLAETLSGDGLFTIFAPSDEAFAQLPEGAVESLLSQPDQLVEVLTYHVAPGLVTAAEAAQRRSLLTFQGEEVHFSADGELHIDGARVLGPDVGATNGLLHIIDRVLLPARV